MRNVKLKILMLIMIFFISINNNIFAVCDGILAYTRYTYNVKMNNENVKIYKGAGDWYDIITEFQLDDKKEYIVYGEVKNSKNEMWLYLGCYFDTKDVKWDKVDNFGIWVRCENVTKIAK